MDLVTARTMTKARTRREQLRSWLVRAAFLASGALAVGSPTILPAQAKRMPREAEANAAEQSADVRLNFASTLWPDVLQHVAKVTGSRLVLDECPRGRFTRVDTKLHSRADAVRILNRDLEPLGFRLLEKGRYLVLIPLRDLRNEYRQSEVVQTGGVPRETEDDGNLDLAAAAATVNPKLRPPQPRPTQPPRAARPAPSRIQQANYEDPDAAEEEQPPASRTASMLRVTLQNRKAVDVARTIFEGSKKNAELVDDGPGGLPAFTVKADAPTGKGEEAAAPRVDYVVGIDADRNELIVAASPARARQIERLIQMLDARQAKRDDVDKLVPVRGETRRLAGGLQNVVNQVAQAEKGDEPAPVEQPAPPRRERPVAPGAKPGEEAPNAPRGNAPGLALVPPVQLQLQGPVTVREVPGVGLVVTGNRADVDAVLDVIRVLELAGGNVTPQIHLLRLQHVNSEAMAELLNTVYDNLAEIRSPLVGENRKTVRFSAVVKPNAILIVAPEREIESVLELAEALDQAVDPESEVEVFRLKSAVASQVVTSIDAFYATRPPMGTRVKAVADVRTNAVIVYARPNDLKEVARLIKKIDLGTSGAVSRMRIFPLKNATATELATLINNALQSVLRPPPTPTATAGQAGAFPGAAPTAGGAAGTTPTQLTEVKSTILEFLSSDGDQEKLIRSGILADIRITADAGRNTLIVSAPEQSMPLLEVLISQLDQPTPLVAEIKVFTLNNSDATATVELLRGLFTGQQQQQQQGGFGAGPVGGGTAAGGIQLAGAEGAGAGLIPLRFTVDPRTNTVIAIGPGPALEIVEAILLKLDASDIRQRRTAVIKLKNTFANDVALALNQFLTAQRNLAQLDPNLITTIQLLEREIIVVPELVSNSLIISATPRYFQDAITMIDKLDQKHPEVVIQALLVEVDLTNTDEFGVELGLQDSILFRRSLANVPGFLFNNQQLGNNTAAPSPGTVGGQSLTNFNVGRTNSDQGFGGLVLSASSESVSVLIRALSSKRTVHVLSRPQIRTLDNQIAQILVGQQVPVATGVATTGLTAASPQVQLRDVGIVLNVIPRISPDGTIVMEVAATHSSVSATRVPIFTDINTGNTVDSPIINVTSAQATISVPNGQTVVLGGMITKSDDAFERKAPWLGDLPYVGNLFRYSGVNAHRTELLVFLTPRVIRHESDSELIKRVEAERLHFIERDAEELHGPLYSAPPPEWYLNQQPPPDGGMPRCLSFDERCVPTTVMPSAPDGSVMPLPTGRVQQQPVGPGPRMNSPPATEGPARATVVPEQK